MVRKYPSDFPYLMYGFRKNVFLTAERFDGTGQFTALVDLSVLVSERKRSYEIEFFYLKDGDEIVIRHSKFPSNKISKFHLWRFVSLLLHSAVLDDKTVLMSYYAATGRGTTRPLIDLLGSKQVVDIMSPEFNPFYYGE